jgi:NAD(P)-dependent dehydrogenase (short-subunit alcohol dehydrogenase family)
METTSPNRNIALVTGANKGIGLETARQLAQLGMHVLLGIRNPSVGTQIETQLRNEGLSVEFIELDMENTTHFTGVKSYIETTFGRLDVLVNNAGIMIESDSWSENTSTTIPMDILRKTMDVNFFGIVELTNILLPLLHKSSAGRIVNLSSILGSLTYHATPGSNTYNTKTFAYNTSKTALNSYTIHLAHALSGTSIKVNSAHPGWVQTDMGGEMAPLSPQEGTRTSVQLATLPDDGVSGTYLHLGNPLPW